MLLGLKHHQMFGAVGAMSGPYLISRQSPNMDMTAREQQTFGTPGSPERLERDPVTLLAAMEKYGRARGVASLCIGGGEATAVAVERLG